MNNVTEKKIKKISVKFNDFSFLNEDLQKKTHKIFNHFYDVCNTWKMFFMRDTKDDLDILLNQLKQNPTPQNKKVLIDFIRENNSKITEEFIEKLEEHSIIAKELKIHSDLLLKSANEILNTNTTKRRRYAR